MSEPRARWRHALLVGAVAGLLAGPSIHPPAGWLPCLLAGAAAAAFAGREVLAGAAPGRAAQLAWLGCLVALAALAGLGVGAVRSAAIDAGALGGAPGSETRLRGSVAGTPRHSLGTVRAPLQTPGGKVMLVTREPAPELPVGHVVEARGDLAEPSPFWRPILARQGIRLELRARRVRLTGARRGGIAGLLDRLRERAERALDADMSAAQAALARGFVLGQDDRIEARVREQFRRAGLSHLLAVSGQNVILLAVLAGLLLAVFGAPLRTRLLLTLLVVALYVPVAGAGPSIQRAAVMGAAGIVATLAGRPADRAYPLLLAAVATLAINPRFAGDPGWQLSFAAVGGIMLWAAPLRERLAMALPARLPGRLRRPLAEAAALTLAATIATAPLIAHSFERLSLAALPANLLVSALIGPVMWLGMLIATLGQLPDALALPLGPLGFATGFLIDAVAAIARVFAAPSWAELPVGMSAPSALIAGLASLAAVPALLAVWRRRRGLGPPALAALGVSLLVLLLLGPPALPGRSATAPPAGTLRITQLDVGQGSAVLLQPPRGAPVLVDGGPPGGAAVRALEELGIRRLRAAFLSHDELDHAGGLSEVLAAIPAGRLVRGLPAPGPAAVARAAGDRVVAVEAGDSLRFGPLRIDVLWPTPAARATAAREPNRAALVLAVSFRGYHALLPGDAELERTGLTPGALDVLVVAHHGSTDAGLDALLARSAPRVALIGVGAGNPYGHPTEETLAALAEHDVCTLRTDRDGAVSVDLGPGGLSARTSAGPPDPARTGCPGSA